MKTLDRGQISIFLCIIMLGVVGLAALLVDLSRISSGNAIADRAVRNSARSVLAGYSTRLKENYGVFALSPDKYNELEDNLKKYLELNLEEASMQGGLRLYDFRIEELAVKPVFNLTDDNVFKQQILEYMKYRAPKQLAEGFLERFKLLGSFNRMAEAYRQKLAIDKLAGRMDKYQQKLKKLVDGLDNGKSISINSFNISGNWSSIYSNVLELYNKCMSLKNEAAWVREELAGLKSELEGLYDLRKENKGAQTDSADDIEKQIKQIIKKISELSCRLNELNSTITSINSDIGKVLSTLKKDMTEPYISINSEAAQNLNNIISKSQEINTAISVLESYLKVNFNLSSTYLSGFCDTAAGDITKLKGLLPGGEMAGRLLGKFNTNSSTLAALSEKLQIVSGIMNGTGQGSLQQVSDDIYGILRDYDNNITYNYAKPESSSKSEDPRKGKAEAVKQFLEEKILKDKNYLSSGFSKEELPSACKTSDGNSGNDIGGKEDNFAGKVDLYDEEGSFQDDTFSSLGKLLSGLSVDSKALLDNIYINEYIMGVFKNAVPELKTNEKTTDDIDIHGEIKKTRQTFYDCEVEYILHGKASQNVNKTLAAGQLLLVRFGFDTLHVYTDPKKKELATAAAAALAGWWTGGAGIPVISNLIMCGWGMGEALLDVRELLDGKKVPVIKSEGDWKLDIGLPKGGRKTDSVLSFSYHDYLRLFLMVLDEKSKLGRMEDLIQLNMGSSDPGFKVRDCNTCITIEAVISIKYLFATQTFMPSKVKTPDGRHKFTVVISEGY